MYKPAEDSLFFAEFLKLYLAKLTKKQKSVLRYLDMGTGSGILSEVVIQEGIRKENILAADIDNSSLSFVKVKSIRTLKTNLFSKIKGKFDLITFNAPYLPASKHDKKKDTTGGKKGDETPLEFLKQARKYLKKDGKIFLLISSFTPINRINKLKPKPKVVAKQHIFFEDLIIIQLS